MTTKDVIEQLVDKYSSKDNQELFRAELQYLLAVSEIEKAKESIKNINLLRNKE